MLEKLVTWLDFEERRSAGESGAILREKRRTSIAGEEEELLGKEIERTMSGRRWREERFSWMMFLPAESSGTCTFLTALFCVSFCTGNLQRETTVETRFLLFFFLHFFFFFFYPPLFARRSEEDLWMNEPRTSRDLTFLFSIWNWLLFRMTKWTEFLLWIIV